MNAIICKMKSVVISADRSVLRAYFFARCVLTDMSPAHMMLNPGK